MKGELEIFFKRKMVLQKIQVNSLPNEMWLEIFAKLDVQELIAIRGVCGQWQTLIEDICHKKRSLVIFSKYGQINISNLSQRFNGLVDFDKNLAILKQLGNNNPHVISLSNGFSILLAKLFPHVENLVFMPSLNRAAVTTQNLFFLLNLWSSSIATLYLQPTFCNFSESYYTALSDHINKLPNLKRLDFQDVDLRNQTTLARLEHYTFETNDILKIAPILETTCTSLYLLGDVTLDTFTKLFNCNVRLAKGLTHLRLTTEDPVLPFLCANYSSLQILKLFFGEQIFDANTIAQLAQLFNLSQLSINLFKINLNTLTQSYLSSLNSVRILSMSDIAFKGVGRQFDGEQFCRVFCRICPNLEQLTIKQRDAVVRGGISQHLDQFVNLNKHTIAPPD